ncbi:hypothetical protein Golax_017056, partial [Gossypium laxum]|nr:hypothetical protein [Gossypium laxum]
MPSSQRSSDKTESWAHLYLDGAVKVDPRDVAVGGVIRDNKWRWILGFNRWLGQCSVFNAELWGILDDMLLLQNRRCDRVLIWTESTKVLQAIHEAFSLTSFSALIRCIHKLLQEVGHWELEYIPREENLEADSITNMAFVKNE